MSFPVTAAQPSAGSGLKSQVDSWRDAFAARFEQAVDAGLTPSQALALCTRELLAPPVGSASLRDLPANTAQEMVADRGKAMQDFLTSWAEGIRRNARADQRAHQRRLLLADEVGRFAPAALRRAQQRLSSRMSKLPTLPAAEPPLPAPQLASAPGTPLAAAFHGKFDGASVNLRKPLV